ncbi:MAG: phosphatase [Planctomycetaceae bacterium]|nr:MAG: phosphatase [Planctomycetaceae bacterium]
MTMLDRRQFVMGSATLGAWWWWTGGEGLSARACANPLDDQPPSGLDSLFLTWQRDPTTTMTIQWVGPSQAQPLSIRYAPAGQPSVRQQDVRVKPYVGTDLHVFRCELTELQPGTDYIFRIGNHPQEYRFRTMPAKTTDELTFVTGGDAGVAEAAVRSNLIAARQNPWFVLIMGDLAYDNGRSPETFLKFLQNYSRTMIDAQGRLIPLIAGIGNHEVNGGYRATRDKAPSYLSVFDGFYAEKTYGVLDIGDYMSLVLLDTGHIAPVAGEQTAWLEQVLRDRQDRPHLIVANHVPCYPSVRDPQGKDGGLGVGEEQRQHWCPLFERYGVDLVLEHHDHAFKRTHRLTNGMCDPHGVLYLGDGSWGKLRVPKTPEERPYLAKTESTYHITTHKIQGENRFHIALDDQGRIADVTLTQGKRPARKG